jgi:hypothetical protein
VALACAVLALPCAGPAWCWSLRGGGSGGCRPWRCGSGRADRRRERGRRGRRGRMRPRREEFQGTKGGNDGGVRVTPGDFGLSGPHAGRAWEFSRASSTLSRSEARFELLSRARLRAVFGGRWAVPSWPDPTYQTGKRAKIWGEMGNSLSTQPTKHALSWTMRT